jgi:hypothetical protein
MADGIIERYLGAFILQIYANYGFPDLKQAYVL